MATWHFTPPHACALSYSNSTLTDNFTCNPRENWIRQEQHAAGQLQETLFWITCWSHFSVKIRDMESLTSECGVKWMDEWRECREQHIHRLMVRMNCNNFLIDLLPRLDRGISLRVARCFTCSSESLTAAVSRELVVAHIKVLLAVGWDEGIYLWLSSVRGCAKLDVAGSGCARLDKDAPDCSSIVINQLATGFPFQIISCHIH